MQVLSFAKTSLSASISASTMVHLPSPSVLPNYCTNTTYSSCHVTCDVFEEMDNSSNPPGTCDILENSSLQTKILAYFGQMQMPYRGKFF